MSEPDPVEAAPVVGAPCPACALASRLVEQSGARTAACPRCEGLFVPEDDLTPVLGRGRRALPPTRPPVDAQERLCPCCATPLYGVLCAGIAAARCPRGHGVFFEKERRAVFDRLLKGGSPDVVAAGHVAHPPRLQRPGYLRVFGGPLEGKPQNAVGPWAAAALVAGLLLIAWKLGA